EADLPARPPKIEPRHRQDQAPASRKLDDGIAEVAEHQRAVQLVGDADEASGVVIGTQRLARYRIDEDANGRAGLRLNEPLIRAAWLSRRIDARDLPAWERSECAR